MIRCPSCGRPADDSNLKFFFARMEDETGYVSPETYVYECECGACWGESESLSAETLTFDF